MLNYKALREKEKMLVISNLSLSHAVFYSFKDKFHRLSNRLFVVCNFFHFDQPKMHNVEGVKLQNIANSNFFSPEKILLCRSMIRLHLWCLFWLSAFSHLSTIFSVIFFFTVVKILDRVVKDNFYQKYFKDCFPFPTVLMLQHMLFTSISLNVDSSLWVHDSCYMFQLSPIPTLSGENNRFLLCLDCYFAQEQFEPRQVGIFTHSAK